MLKKDVFISFCVMAKLYQVFTDTNLLVYKEVYREQIKLIQVSNYYFHVYTFIWITIWEVLSTHLTLHIVTANK